VKDIPELPGVTDVPEGVVRLIELQEQGFAYIRV
jgi:intracellular sulfur oxidation DsrE/DsrF family protein